MGTPAAAIPFAANQDLTPMLTKAKLLTVKEHESIETDVIKGQDKHKDVTEKCR